MQILSFESSCDETSCAVVEYRNGVFNVKSNIVASQIEIHARFGGVVPEIASRAHCEVISKIAYEALAEAGADLDKDIDAVAVTSSPGLIGALLVGVNFAKSLAYSHGLPLVSVNHMKGHIAANYISNPQLKPPFLTLIASGGHTSFVIVSDYTKTKTVGSTRDDAMGEAFDKVARVMGMPYPGGAALDKLAYEGSPVLKFPSSAITGETLDMSFSGIIKDDLNYTAHEFADRLEEIMQTKEPFTFRAGDKIFENYIFTSFTPRRETEAGIQFDAEIKVILDYCLNFGQNYKINEDYRLIYNLYLEEFYLE